MEKDRRPSDDEDLDRIHLGRRVDAFRLVAATPGTYHATYAAPEFVHMIEGRITITPDGGQPVTVGPGDAFVVEADFKGTWKITEEVFKHFTIKLK